MEPSRQKRPPVRHDMRATNVPARIQESARFQRTSSGEGRRACLGLLDALAPASEMLKIRPNLGDGLRHSGFTRIRRDVLARRGVGVIHGGIIEPNRVAKRDGRKIGLLAAMLGARNEADDFCAHENPSHIAVAIRPASASKIRYALMPISSD